MQLQLFATNFSVEKYTNNAQCTPRELCTPLCTSRESSTPLHMPVYQLRFLFDGDLCCQLLLQQSATPTPTPVPACIAIDRYLQVPPHCNSPKCWLLGLPSLTVSIRYAPGLDIYLSVECGVSVLQLALANCITFSCHIDSWCQVSAPHTHTHPVHTHTHS